MECKLMEAEIFQKLLLMDYIPLLNKSIGEIKILLECLYMFEMHLHMENNLEIKEVMTTQMDDHEKGNINHY